MATIVFCEDDERLQKEGQLLAEQETVLGEAIGAIAKLAQDVLDRSNALTDVQKKRLQQVRKDAQPRDIPMIMCALAGTFRNPTSNPDRYIGIALDGLRAPGSKHTKLPPAA